MRSAQSPGRRWMNGLFRLMAFQDTKVNTELHVKGGGITPNNYPNRS